MFHQHHQLTSNFMKSFLLILAAGSVVIELAAAQSTATVAEPPPLPTRTQVIDLQKGWNSVWLEVDPLYAAAEKVFAGTPVDICARFFRPVTSAEFIKDPAEKPFNQEGWGVWYAPSREDAIVKTLDRVDGHAGYLVHARQAHRWSLTGTVQFKPLEWKHGAFTLAGFAVDDAQPPTFGEYFAGSDGHVGSQVLRLVEGRWQRIQANVPMRAGEACWIYAAGDSHYQGPLTVDLNVSVLDFGATSGSVSLTHVNSSPSAHTITAELVSAGSSVPGTGGLPLVQVKVDIPTLSTSTAPVTGALPELESGYADSVRLQVQRGQMTSATQTALLKLSDGNGALVWVPVRASR